MPTFAILGATGEIGGTVLKFILDNTSHRVHCSVRSKSKLFKQFSRTAREKLESRSTIFEGDLTKIDTLRQCVQGTDVVYLCAAASTNQPGCTVAQDQATAMVTVLQKIKSDDPSSRLPKLVMLTSSETEKKFRDEIPSLVGYFLFRANWHVYQDLIAAERYLRDHEELVTTIFMKPGGLSRDILRGHKLTTETHQTFLSMLDLAAGMVEVAETAVDGDKWDMKAVSVISPSGKANINWRAGLVLLRGLMIYYFPWTFAYIG